MKYRTGKQLYRIVTCALAVVLCAALLMSCGNKAGAKGDDGKLTIVATLFPEYDWAKQVLGDRAGDKDVELVMLADDGVDMHNYQPTVEDIDKITKSDVFLYVGGESDFWIDDVLKNTNDAKMHRVAALDAIGIAALGEETQEGMQEDEHEHEEAEHQDEEDEEAEHKERGPALDEHVWLSVRNAEVIVAQIEKAIAAADPEHAGEYEANAQAYIKELKELDDRYEETVETAPKKAIVVGDRFPLRYLVEDYGLDYYAAFPGCYAEAEASFETVEFLAKKCDELGLSAILKIDGSKDAIARTIRKNTKTKDQKILTIDSMQSATSKDAAKGKTYLGTMEKDLKVLRRALR